MFQFNVEVISIHRIFSRLGLLGGSTEWVSSVTGAWGSMGESDLQPFFLAKQVSS